MLEAVKDIMRGAVNRNVVAKFQESREKPNGIIETFNVTQFVVNATKPSVLVKGATVPDPTNSYMVCPRCKEPGPKLEHGDLAICKCGTAHGAVRTWP